MIKKIKTQETYSIRLEVLRKKIDLPFQFKGDLDKNTIHLGAFKNNKIVGVATLMHNKCALLEEENQYQLRGMATLLKVRGENFGTHLLETSFSILKEKKVKVLWCNAREVALGFYQKKGFKIIGEPFNINKIGKHYTLVKHLK